MLGIRTTVRRRKLIRAWKPMRTGAKTIRQTTSRLAFQRSCSCAGCHDHRPTGDFALESVRPDRTYQRSTASTRTSWMKKYRRASGNSNRSGCLTTQEVKQIRVSDVDASGVTTDGPTRRRGISFKDLLSRAARCWPKPRLAIDIYATDGVNSLARRHRSDRGPRRPLLATGVPIIDPIHRGERVILIATKFTRVRRRLVFAALPSLIFNFSAVIAVHARTPAERTSSGYDKPIAEIPK